MEIRKVQYFRTVVEAGGLVKAAGVLHVTPGTLSKAIRSLEDEVGKTLFHRAGRRLTLTDDGTSFYRLSERLVDEHTRILRALDESETPATSTLRLASFEVFTTHCLGGILESLPDVELRVLDVPPPGIETALLEHEADAGITYTPSPHRELAHRRVERIEFGIYGRRGALTGVEFEALPFAIPTSSVTHAPAEILGIDCWPYHRIKRRVKYRVTCMETALELARRGRAVVFLPRFIAALHNRSMRRGLQLVRRDGPPQLRPVHQIVHIVTRESDRQAAFVPELVRAVRAAIRGAAD